VTVTLAAEAGTLKENAAVAAATAMIKILRINIYLLRISPDQTQIAAIRFHGPAFATKNPDLMIFAAVSALFRRGFSQPLPLTTNCHTACL
jgi:hypothetical protein